MLGVPPVSRGNPPSSPGAAIHHRVAYNRRRHLPVEPDRSVVLSAVHTAQDINSFKPNEANFEYAAAQLQNTFGAEKGGIPVVICSLLRDHDPADQLALKSESIDYEGATLFWGFENSTQ